MFDNYEELVHEIAEIREAMDLLHQYMNCMPQFGNLESYYDLIGQHAPNLALLKLIMDKLDMLHKDHINIIEKEIKA